MTSSSPPDDGAHAQTQVTPAPPSVHIRAALTWIAIFPLVSIGMLAFAPLWPQWHPILRALVLTLIVVPLAVYVVVPQLLRAYHALSRRGRGSRSDAG